MPNSVWQNYLINFKEIIVFARRSCKNKDKQVKSSNVNVSFYLTTKYSSVFSLLINFRSVYRELNSFINEADIILVRLPSVLGLIAGKIALKNKKYLWVEQVGNTSESLMGHGSILGKFIAPVFEYINYKIVCKANFISYVTEVKLQNDYPASSYAIKVSLSNVIIKECLGENKLDKDRFFGEVYRIGLIGSFDARYKGQDLLLKAIHLLEDNIKSKVKLCFVGKGDYTWVVNLAKQLDLIENIEFIGSLKAGIEVNDFLQTLSLYVQPSITEGMPRATIEAMAMGCPVIGSDVGGIPEIVSSQFVHRKKNIKEFSNHIKILFFERDTLYSEAKSSLIKVKPYLKEVLDNKRIEFYSRINSELIIKN